LFGTTVAKNQGSSHKDFLTTASIAVMISSDMSRVATDDPEATDVHTLR
jgi:hypothetical protein